VIPLEELRVAEMDRRGNAGYRLTPEEKAMVERLNQANGVAHLVADRNTHNDAHRTDFRRGRERKNAPGRIRGGVR